MKSLSQMKDAEYLAWARNLVSVLEANPGDFGVSAAQVTDLKDSIIELEAKMQERVAAYDFAAASTKAQQMSRQSSEPKGAYLKAIIKANPAIPEDKKVQAGIEPDKPASHTPPTAPTNLIVNGFENGTNVLKWKRAGNKAGTQYMIECRYANQTEFVMLDVVTEVTYIHVGVTPGVQCAYRVKAKRAGESSTYSNIAVVYMA